MDYEPTQVTADEEHLPPGTQRIETSAGTKIVLSPVPTSDPESTIGKPVVFPCVLDSTKHRTGQDGEKSCT